MDFGPETRASFGDPHPGRCPQLLAGPVRGSHPSPHRHCTRAGASAGSHTDQARARGKHWTAGLTPAPDIRS